MLLGLHTLGLVGLQLQALPHSPAVRWSSRRGARRRGRELPITAPPARGSRVPVGQERMGAKLDTGWAASATNASATLLRPHDGMLDRQAMGTPPRGSPSRRCGYPPEAGRGVRPLPRAVHSSGHQYQRSR